MPSRPFLRRPAVLLVLALCAVAAVVSILGKLTGGSDAVKKPITLVSPGGAEAYPAFSPDGKRLVYSVRLTKDQGFHLFVRSLPMGERRQLTDAAGSDIAPVWSPDGSSVAFLRLEDGSAACMVVPAAGGAERKVADCATAVEAEQPRPAVAWTPDGQSVVVAAAGENQLPAIALVPAAGGAPKPLTIPPKGTQGDSTPAVSPDGQTVAFVRNSSEEDADIFACNLSGGNLQRLTFDGRAIRGIAWTPDGSHLVYAGHRMGTWRLWRLPAAGGSSRDLGFERNGSQYPALARTGGRLAYTDSPTVSAIWRQGLGADSGSLSLIRSSGREAAPAWSPDGQKIADISDQTGNDEIWVCDAEGRHRTQLTHFNGRMDPSNPRWSPDGQSILFGARGGDVSEVDTVPSGGGTPKRVLLNASAASWSNDGKTVYYQARGEVWKAAADGSGPRALTTQGGGQPAESPDGKFLYYGKQREIWRVPSEGGTEEPAVQPENGFIMGGGKVTAKGVYYVEWRQDRDMRMRRGRGGGMPFNSAPITVCFYDFGTRKSTPIFETEVMDFSGIAISPDGKYILYPKVDASETTLMLVEGFK
jgi:Tol biopolymer transport system component